MFALCRANQHVHAQGVRRRLRPSTPASLDAHIAHFFQALGCDEGPPILVGAIPFDIERPASIYQPERIDRGAGAGPFASMQAGSPLIFPSPLGVVADPDPAGYAQIVREALERIERGEFEKTVLARSLCIETSMPIDPMAVARRLAQDPSVTIFAALLPVGDGDEKIGLVGATPELLVSRSGSAVVSHPLAGSAARSKDSATDAQAAHALLGSEKDQREHRLVVEAILDQLSPVCTMLSAPAGPTLSSTASMWHLGTRIEGCLKPDAPSAAGLAAILHPTPAVGGSPRQAALAAIRDLEPHDRGFYAGAIGWTDAQGDGEWHLTLRCAEIRGAKITLHAGAGIVAGSDPQAEVDETAAKFRAMLRALDMERQVDILEMAF